MKRFLFFICICMAVSLTSQAQESGLNIDSLTQVGIQNAVKKAYQMTELAFVPVGTFYPNSAERKPYVAGQQYKGVIYSSTKETNTFVGQDVSFHTFMTAMHNPRSVLYTIQLDKAPYHGSNCRAYYGTVCSGLVNYALCIKLAQRSTDILESDRFELIPQQNAKGVQVADIIARDGHPRIVTAKTKNSKGQTVIEICVAYNSGSRRYTVVGEKAFDSMLRRNGYKIFRYKDIWQNTEYTPVNEFVAVAGEEKLPFEYNEEICANKGDESCYITGEDIIINVLGKGEKVQIYKDNEIFDEIYVQEKDTDLVLKGYAYGNYKARLVKKTGRRSHFTRWKVIDVNVSIDKEKNRICFSSANAKPVYYEFSTIGGSRPTNKNRTYAALFTEEDLKNGYVKVQPPKKPEKGKSNIVYVKVHFESKYGMSINKPLNWYD